MLIFILCFGRKGALCIFIGVIRSMTKCLQRWYERSEWELSVSAIPRKCKTHDQIDLKQQQRNGTKYMEGIHGQRCSRGEGQIFLVVNKKCRHTQALPSVLTISSQRQTLLKLWVFSLQYRTFMVPNNTIYIRMAITSNDSFSELFLLLYVIKGISIKMYKSLPFDPQWQRSRASSHGHDIK